MDDGLIQPRKLVSLTLDSVQQLLHRALEIVLLEGGGEGELLRELLGLEQGYCFSSLLSDQLLSRFAEKGQLNCRILECFCRNNIGCITKICLSACPDLNEKTLCLLLQHPLLELTLSVSAASQGLVKWEHLEHLSKHPAGATLRSFTVGCTNETYPPDNDAFVWLRNLKSLVRLDFHDMYLPVAGETFGEIVEQLPGLAVLNLARTSISDLRACNSNLKALSVNGIPVHLNHTLFGHIIEIRSLVSLDLSQLDYNSSGYGLNYGMEFMRKLSRMPSLKYLDVSGHQIYPFDLDCFDPPHHRMSFFGLLATRACRRMEFNCDMISGDSNEEQFLVSLKTYTDRKDFMKFTLHKLFSLADDGHLNSHHEKLILALLPLFAQASDNHLLPASACLWHLTKEENKEQLTTNTAKQVIVTLVKLLDKHLRQQFLTTQTVKNCALCLCNFLFPEDVEFVYSRVVKVLVGVLTNVPHSLVQSIAISLMNGAVWQVSLEQKVLMKETGGIQAALHYIEEKTALLECDQALEMAWSFLWNVTDETPENNVELLRCNGLEMLVRCYKNFRNTEDEGGPFLNMLRNMLGALGNVAEVKFLRPRLLNTELLEIFRSIFLTVKELEVQYNIGGIVCNLAMEEESLWLGMQPSKAYLLHLMEHCVEEWDLGQSRNIQYRSLKPIIAVIDCLDERVALWGAWALANLCQVYPHKYGPMLKRDGGIEPVEHLCLRANTPRVRELASKVLSQFRECPANMDTVMEEQT